MILQVLNNRYQNFPNMDPIKASVDTNFTCTYNIKAIAG